jgi:hypothetical protein
VPSRESIETVCPVALGITRPKSSTFIWRVDTNAHDTNAMSSNFYYFAQKLFKE